MRYLFLTILVPFFSFSHAKDLAYEAVVHVGKVLYADEGLFPIRARRWVHGEIFKLGIAVEKYEEQDINSAREVILRVSTQFLTIINNEKNLRPYLCSYPFLPENIELELRFKKPSYDDVSPGTISRIVLDEGRIRYYVDVGYSDRLALEESYQEAISSKGR